MRESQLALDWLAGPGPCQSSFGIDELHGAEGRGALVTNQPAISVEDGGSLTAN